MDKKKVGYWRSKVIPTMKKFFERSPTKKAVVVETSRDLTFDDSKEAINKEIEEKKTELLSKVVEIYKATTAEFKALVKEPTEDGLKSLSDEVHKFIEELVKIDFPGSKAVSELSTSLGPVSFIFEKVCVFLPVVEIVKTEEPAKVEETKPEEIATATKEIEIVAEKKEEVKPEPVPVPVSTVTIEEKKPVVEEEKKVAVEEKKPAVEEKKAPVEEKKPVEEVKKEVAPVPVAVTPVTKAPETPAKAPEAPAKAPETPAKTPETPAAQPQKA